MDCSCEIPKVMKMDNVFLGTKVEVRLCCMAKKLEELTGETFYKVTEGAPTEVWDETEQQKVDQREQERQSRVGVIDELTEALPLASEEIDEDTGKTEKEIIETELASHQKDLENHPVYKRKKRPQWLKDRMNSKGIMPN